MPFALGRHSISIGAAAEQARREVKMPRDFACVVVEAHQLPDWPDIELELVGADARDLSFPSTWTHLEGELDPESGGSYRLLLVRAQIRLKTNASLCLEALWDRGSETITMYGLETDPPPGDVDQLLRAQALLRDLKDRGRPPVDGEDFRRRTADIWLRLYAASESGRRPTQNDVADEYALDRDYFRRLRRKHIGVPWARYRPDRRP